MSVIIKNYRVFIFAIFLITLSGNTFGQNSNQVHPDTPKKITLAEFQSRVDRATMLIKTKKLNAISDTDHINIIMCINTIHDVNLSFLEPKLTAKRYKKFEAALTKVDYSKNIIKVYPIFSWNTGLGYYFPKLNIELDGIPAEYSMFAIEGTHVKNSN